MSNKSDPIVLGAGDVFFTRLVPNPTPVHIAYAQKTQLDLSWEEATLHGRDDLPDHVARTKAKITGSITIARFMRGVAEAVLEGSKTTAGGRLLALGESTGVIAGATYQAQHAEGFQDLGVKDENDEPMVCVAGAPAAGEYGVAADGEYTFNAAATGKTYTVTYAYADAVNGKTVAYSAQAIGASVGSRIDIFGETDGLKYSLTLYKATLSSFAAAFETTQHTQPEVKFTAYKDAAKKALDLRFPG